MGDDIELLSKIDDAECNCSYTELITSRYLSDLTSCASKCFWNAHCPDCSNVAHISIYQKNCSAENLKFWKISSNGL